jgi:hypothetical protein
MAGSVIAMMNQSGFVNTCLNWQEVEVLRYSEGYSEGYSSGYQVNKSSVNFPDNRQHPIIFSESI